jgi:hypothetical protein
MTVKNLKLDVIATFNKHEQEFFMLIFLDENTLKSEDNLLKYILKQLDHKDDLVKLSLCWICDQNIVKKYKTIQKSVSKNAKYFFEYGKLLTN